MIFRRRRVPAWSAFEDRAAHDQFVEVLREHLRTADLGEGEPDDDGRLPLASGRPLDLGQVTTEAVRQPAESWDEVVRGFVASATNPNRAPTSPSELLPAVRTRLMTVDALTRFPKDLPHRVHGDLAEVLLIDTDTAVVWAAESDLAPLGAPLDELFDLGRDNVARSEAVTTTPLTGDDGWTLEAAATHDYVASWALLVDRLVPLPADGAIVAVPTKRSLLVHPVASALDDTTLARMTEVVESRRATGPGALSPRLYRWRGGELAPHR